jgi:glycosyltransferase involved in cell wall biosynthesis
MHGLRVLHVTPYSPAAWGYGGIPRLTGALARGLAARGHAVTVCATDACDSTRRLSSEHDDPLDATGRIDVRIFRNVSNRLAYRYQCFLPRGLSAYLRTHAHEFDVAHLHACRNVPGAIAAYHLSRAGVPFVLAPNGTAANIERRRTLKFAFDLAAGRRMVARAQRLIAVSHAERRQLERMGVTSARIRVVPNPVDTTEFGDAARARGGVDFRAERGPIVAYLGQLTPRKRVPLLVHAFARLPHRSATLVIGGNDMGAESNARLAAAEAGVAARTRFRGLVSGSDRVRLLAAADVVVYPSEHEAFGLVPLEALLAGTPVVVADDGGCGEIIRSVGGGIVVPGQVGPLSAAIETILRAPIEWRGRAVEAAARVRARFAPDVVCTELEAVYLELTAAA